jgi:hypothetical protein
MKRLFAFFIVFLLLSFSLPFTYGDHHNSYFKGDAQESGLLYEHTTSTDDHPDTAVFIAFTAFLMIIYLCTKITWSSVRPFRRLIFLNPIFHQSNYVIKNL